METHALQAKKEKMFNVKNRENHHEVRIPKKLCDDACLEVRGKIDIHSLVALMPKGYVAKEEDWGNPVGKEIW